MQCNKYIVQLCLFGLSLIHLSLGELKSGHYTGEWAVHIEGGEEKARKVAKDYGFEFLGKVSQTRETDFLYYFSLLL